MTQSRTVVSIVGARPQFVKAAAISPALRAAGIHEILIHTGQHYDWAMSEAFFAGLGIPAPDVNLQIGSASHGAQTGRMLEALEGVLLDTKPAMVVVLGDTNSTLAGALAAIKLHIPVAHVEAGLRSFDRAMPEEVNRVLADHISTILFAPTSVAVANLAAERITEGVFRTGDVMLDVVEYHRHAILAKSQEICKELGLPPRGFVFATVHRPENTDNDTRWNGILTAFASIAQRMPVVWAAHPRTRERVRGLHLPGILVLEPQPYLQTQGLICAARVVLTDSGGLQKEAAFHRTPCVTLRDRTEWGELVDAGVNVLAGANRERIVAATKIAKWPEKGLPPGLYGDGQAAVQISSVLAACLLDRPDGKRPPIL
jgi:UDP-GlcNAc3NAcA epimerase